PGVGCEVVRIGEPGEVSISVAASMGRLVGSLVADMARHRMIDVAPGKADGFCQLSSLEAGRGFDLCAAGQSRPDCHGRICTMGDRSLVTSGKALACNRFLDTFGDNSRRSLPRLPRDPMYLCSRCRLVSSDEAGGQ